MSNRQMRPIWNQPSKVDLSYISQLRFNYDTTTIQRYHDAFDYDESDRNYDMRSIRLRYNYDTIDYDEKLTC